MRKYRRSVRRGHREKQLAWLPVDSRLMYPLFSFGRVRGIARIFLEIEVVLAVGVVIGTFLLFYLSLLK